MDAESGVCFGTAWSVPVSVVCVREPGSGEVPARCVCCTPRQGRESRGEQVCGSRSEEPRRAAGLKGCLPNLLWPAGLGCYAWARLRAGTSLQGAFPQRVQDLLTLSPSRSFHG